MMTTPLPLSDEVMVRFVFRASVWSASRYRLGSVCSWLLLCLLIEADMMPWM